MHPALRLAATALPLCLPVLVGCGAGSAPVTDALVPAAAASSSTPAAGRTVDLQATARGACDEGSAGAVVLGDLDGDADEESAVPLSCAGGEATRVLVYGGGAVGAPRLLGEALPAGERGVVHAVEVRDGHLVVSALTDTTPGDGDADTALTLRWRSVGGTLQLVDRWTDPAYVLEVDE